jgi:hypothetical protein
LTWPNPTPGSAAAPAKLADFNRKSLRFIKLCSYRKGRTANDNLVAREDPLATPDVLTV